VDENTKETKNNERNVQTREEEKRSESSEGTRKADRQLCMFPKKILGGGNDGTRGMRYGGGQEN